MSAAVHAPDIDTILKRANRDLSREAGEEVLSDGQLGRICDLLRGHFEQVVQAARMPDAKLADDLAAAQQARDQALTHARELQDKLTKARRETEQAQRAAEEAAAAVPARQPHRCAYPLDGPDQLPGNCECGKAFPQTVVKHVPAKDKQPDAWTALFDRIRREVGQG